MKKFIVTVGLIGSLAGCTAGTTALTKSAPISPPCEGAASVSRLAGAWLYEEHGYIYTLRLDAAGNGAYEWKDGRFLTTCLKDHEWRGRWIEGGKNNEGEFSVLLDKDFEMGDGRWWTTRVGGDSVKPQRGVVFQLKRIGSRTPRSSPGKGG